MSILHRRLTLAALSAAALLALAACTAGPGSAAPTSTTAPSDQRLEDVRPVPPEGRVLGVGTVLDDGGDTRLCLGPIAESYPPQCNGIPLDDWSWDGLEGTENSGDVTWGAFAVYGSYDGERFASDGEAIMLALFDPPQEEDPTDGVDGTTPEAELTRVQDDLSARLGTEALSLHAERGYVWLDVVWDDGSIQDAVDAEYGEGVVVVTSALQEVG